MMASCRCACAALVFASLWVSAAYAEVVSASSAAFDLRYSLSVPAPPQRAFAAWGQIDQWWSGNHSYSGNARNLRLKLKAGEHFYEQWAGGSVEHARVLLAMPGKLLRLHGGLGPLQGMPVDAVLDVTFAAETGGTRMTIRYQVAGPPDGKLEAMAPLVDKVLGEQVQRLGAHLQAASR
jgi:uncharacterized protein YndB with AHSA1/START domain